VFEYLGRSETPEDHAIIDEYFASISELLYVDFWRTLRDEQHLLVAAGAPYVDERMFQQIPGSQFVTIFLNLGPRRQGWVSPFARHVEFELGRADRTVPHVAALLGDYGVSAPTRPLHPSVDAYARMVSRATRHGLDGSPNEAFLHFVIAVDLLFGEDGKSTKSIAQRTAMLVMSRLDISFEKAVERVREIYDARSRYVHAGVDVAPALVTEAELMCREILFCMLRRLMWAGRSDNDFSANWIRQIDFMASAVEAGKNVPNEEWAASGIDCPGGRSAQK
jgi:hypothetical protein